LPHAVLSVEDAPARCEVVGAAELDFPCDVRKKDITVEGSLRAHEDPTRAILASLQQRIGPQKFNAWFRHATCLSLEDGHVKVGAANPFIAGWIERHFRDDLVGAAREATGQRPELLISVDPELGGRMRKKQLDTQARLVMRDTTGAARKSRRPRPAPKLRYKLEDFIVGSSNRLAHSATAEIAANGTARFNPLFIHGSCGVGKTHLLQGLCQALALADRPLRWKYTTAEQFTNDFVQAIRTKKVDRFREKYRKLDVLAIDDVHFLAAKKATQEEFLHTFNTIHTAGKQVVMASDAHPRMLGQLTDQLVSRFLSGMVVRIEPPDRDTRMAILTRTAERIRLQADRDALEYIALHIRGSVRELEGALVKLAAVAELVGQPVSRALVRETLSDYLVQTDSAVTLGDIETVVASFFGITPADLHSSRRTHTVSLARAIAMHLARRHTRMSYPEIGRFMGKNHSSVVLAVQRVEKMLAVSAKPCRWMTPAGPRTMPARQLMEVLGEQLA